MEAYRGITNSHAFQQITKSIYIPDVQLGVGQGETLAPQLMKVEYQERKQYVVVPETTAIELTQIDGHSAPIKESDFPKEFYIGNVIGGF